MYGVDIADNHHDLDASAISLVRRWLHRMIVRQALLGIDADCGVFPCDKRVIRIAVLNDAKSQDIDVK